MKMKWIALAVAAAIPAAAMAIGGASGPKIDYEVQGHIGEVMGNPYGIAPLTAVIRDGGYTLADVTVHIVPKQGGQKISYKVSRSQLLTHGGVPVFGLYPDYLNTIRVDYTRIDTTGKKEKFSDEYKLYAPPVYFEPAGNTMERMMPFEAEVKKADPNSLTASTSSTTLVRNPASALVQFGTIRPAAHSNGITGRRTPLLIPRVKFVGSCSPTRSMTSIHFILRAS